MADATDATPKDLSAQIMATVDRLFRQFGGTVPRERVTSIVHEAMAEWEGARVKTYVAVLAERSARDRLRELTRARAS
jgi:hypothetical protein